MAPSALTPQTVKRLAFIRLLYQQALDQSRLPEPLLFTSLLIFDDAVELFLALASEHLNAPNPRRIQFLQYWDELHPTKLSGGVDLSAKVAMQRMHEARNHFKHQGVMPSLDTIERARTAVGDFLEDNTPKVFGVDYSKIDMADLVPQQQARETIKKAATTFSGGDRTEAMGFLVDALDDLFKETHAPHDYPPSPFSFGQDLSVRLSSRDLRNVLDRPEARGFPMPPRGASHLASQIEAVTNVASTLQGAMRIVALGIEYHKFVRFRQLTPLVSYYMDGGRGVTAEKGYNPSMDEFDFCQQFVITVALRLAEINSYTAAPSWKVTNQP